MLFLCQVCYFPHSAARMSKWCCHTGSSIKEYFPQPHTLLGALGWKGREYEFPCDSIIHNDLFFPLLWFLEATCKDRGLIALAVMRWKKASITLKTLVNKKPLLVASQTGVWGGNRGEKVQERTEKQVCCIVKCVQKLKERVLCLSVRHWNKSHQPLKKCQDWGRVAGPDACWEN